MPAISFHIFALTEIKTDQVKHYMHKFYHRYFILKLILKSYIFHFRYSAPLIKTKWQYGYETSWSFFQKGKRNDPVYLGPEDRKYDSQTVYKGTVCVDIGMYVFQMKGMKWDFWCFIFLLFYLAYTFVVLSNQTYHTIITVWEWWKIFSAMVFAAILEMVTIVLMLRMKTVVGEMRYGVANLLAPRNMLLVSNTRKNLWTLFLLLLHSVTHGE